MNEPSDSGVPEFMLRSKPRGAPEGLRELVVATVAKELGSTHRYTGWFTRTERRCFQIAGSLLLASVATFFLVELGEQSRMTRVDFKKEIQDQDRDLIEFLAYHDEPKFHEWFRSYRGMAKPSAQSLSQIKNTFRQIIQIDPEFQIYVRGYHGLF